VLSEPEFGDLPEAAMVYTDSELLWFSWTHSGLSMGDTVSLRVTAVEVAGIEPNHVLFEFDSTLEEGPADSGRFSVPSAPSGFWAGRYVAEVLVNDDPFGSVLFSIEIPEGYTSTQPLAMQPTFQNCPPTWTVDCPPRGVCGCDVENSVIIGELLSGPGRVERRTRIAVDEQGRWQTLEMDVAADGTVDVRARFSYDAAGNRIDEWDRDGDGVYEGP